MASITIRGLDDDLKQRLRLRAARNGRSMEDEVRTILRGVAAAETEAAPVPRFRARCHGRAGRADGDAEPVAAHPADHRRRHRGLQIARSHSPPAGARRRGARAC